MVDVFYFTMDGFVIYAEQQHGETCNTWPVYKSDIECSFLEFWVKMA